MELNFNAKNVNENLSFCAFFFLFFFRFVLLLGRKGPCRMAARRQDMIARKAGVDVALLHQQDVRVRHYAHVVFLVFHLV